MDLLDRLLGHDRWATGQLVAVARGLTDAQLDQPVDAGHQTLRATFAHMIFNIQGWTAQMIGQRPDPDREDLSSTGLTDRFEHASDQFSALARRIRDEGRFDETYTDQSGEQMAFGGAILHVLLHNEGHRVELLHILQRLNLPSAPELPEIDHAHWDFVRRGLFQP